MNIRATNFLRPRLVLEKGNYWEIGIVEETPLLSGDIEQVHIIKIAYLLRQVKIPTRYQTGHVNVKGKC